MGSGLEEGEVRLLTAFALEQGGQFEGMVVAPEG